MLDRLVRRAVLAKSDRVMGIDVDRGGRDQRPHAHGIARIVGEHEERRVVGHEAAVQGQPVRDRSHAELADAVVDIVAVRRVRVDVAAAFPESEVRVREVGRAANQLGQCRTVGLERHLRGLARRDRGTFGLQLRDEGVGNPVKAARQRAGHATLELDRELRIRGAVSVEQRAPVRLGLCTAQSGIPGGIDFGRNLERWVMPAEALARALDFVLAERRAVARLVASLGRRAEADGRTHAKQGRLGRIERGRDERRLDRLRVVAVDAGDDFPAVGLETPGGIVGEPALHLAVDRDAVVIPDRDQLAETQGARNRAGLVRYSLHQATVAKEHVGVVVDHREIFLVVARGQQLLGQRHAYRVRQPLAERAGRGLDRRMFAALRVARRARVPLAEALELGHRKIMARQVQQGIQQHRAVPVRQHEPVTIEPARIGRVVAKEVVPEHLGDVGHAHRHAGVARVGLLDGIHGQRTNGVGKFESAGHQGFRRWECGCGGTVRSLSRRSTEPATAGWRTSTMRAFSCEPTR